KTVLPQQPEAKRILKSLNPTSGTLDTSIEEQKKPKQEDWQDQMDSLKRELEEMKLFRQSAGPSLNSQVGRQREYQYQGSQQRNSYLPGNGNMPSTESIPVNDRGCRWCGL